MLDSLQSLRDRFDSEIVAAADVAALSRIRAGYLSRKGGHLSHLLRSLKDVHPEQRPAVGTSLNNLKAYMEARLAEAESALSQERPASGLDVTLPGRAPRWGTFHPVNQVRREVEEIFLEMGFTLAEGPEVETDFYNFVALNFPPDHPARDTQDTFYLEGNLLLRTHTSPVQIRTLQARKPPVKIITLGKVYRRDSDVSHSPMFHQVEGLAVAEGITFGDLKGTVLTFARRVFRDDTQVRFRPSYFPFVEPGAEFDLSCVLCAGKGCSTCKHSGWLEMGGAGMVHPEVLRMAGLDPGQVSGFAFGLGVDRIAMLKFGIDDIRLLFENDLRFLDQFSG
ncbi:MAG TPA: phenylalanine--tRNA ligase subunit alpha [Candidatus Polarisedimenticolia bacterium]|jgi:phenylalanyl-tRNA synthetase alpha chain|nr:phenylalanine--tRNA ligase subunit alpha [Candidatus Polarisedimenticolia bacterium]